MHSKLTVYVTQLTLGPLTGTKRSHKAGIAELPPRQRLLLAESGRSNWLDLIGLNDRFG